MQVASEISKVFSTAGVQWDCSAASYTKAEQHCLQLCYYNPKK